MRALVIKNSMNGGEISPLVLARTDLAKYPNALERCENFIPLITGGLTRRPGTRFVLPALGPSRFIGFEFSVTQTFALEFGNKQMRFFTIVNGVAGAVLLAGIPYVIATPYDTGADDLWDIKVAQQGDVMYITHPNHPLMKLSRITDTNWRLTQVGLQSPPTHGFDQDVSNGAITVTPAAVQGNGVVFTASAPVFIQGDIGKRIISGAGSAVITALGGAVAQDPVTKATLYPQATCDISSAFAGGLIAAGLWFLRGAPQGYLEYADHTGIDPTKVHLSRKLGAGQAGDVFTFAHYLSDGQPFPNDNDQDCFRSIDVGRYLVAAGAVGIIVSLITANHITVRRYSPIEDTTVASVNADIVAAPQSGGTWFVEDPAFSAQNGYPNACTFMQDRLILSGTSALPLQNWGSRVGDYENFAKGPQDSDGLDFGVNAALQQPIRALMEYRGNLGIFTAREEYMAGGGIISVSNGSPQALTPSNVTSIRQSKNGSSRVQPQIIQNMLLYFWRSKLAASEMQYNIYQANFGSRNLNILHELITATGIKESTWQQFPFFVDWFTTLGAGTVGGGGGGGATMLIATGSNNIILTSPDGKVWTTRHADDSSGNTLQAITSDGKNTFVAVGGAQIWSSTDGGVTWVSRAVPVGVIIGVPTDITTGSPFPEVIWDGHQFVCGGEIAGQGIVMTSPDGVTWTKTNVADSNRIIGLAFNGTAYVAVDWRSFIAQKSRIYSAANPTGAWTLRLTSAAQLQYGWVASNGAGFLVFSVGAAQANAYSADGLAWTENTATSLLIEREFFQVIWDPVSARWIANGLLQNGHSGIATSPDGAVWTTRLDIGVAGKNINQSVLRAAGGNLYAYLAGPAGDGNFYISADNGTTWNSAGANPTSSYFQTVVWMAGGYFAALQIPDLLDDQLATSPDGLVWTGHYDDAAGDIALMRPFGGAGVPAAGQLIGLTYEVEQQVWGWHRHFSGQDLAVPDNWVSACSVQDPGSEQTDRLWAVTQRQVNGQTVYYIEIFDPALNSDCASQQVFNAKVTQVGGFGYLQGRTVWVKADGSFLGRFVVPANGTVDFHLALPGGALNVEVGLPYISFAVTVRPEIGQGGQTIQGVKKGWNKVWLRVYNSINVMLGAGTGPASSGFLPTLQRLLGRRKSDLMGAPVAPFTGDVALENNLGSDFDGRIVVQQDQPFPLTVLAPFGILTVGDI